MPAREPARGDGTDWVKAHDELLQIARQRGELEGREGKALLRAMRLRVHVQLGYGSFVEYIERLFGFAPRTSLDELRTAEALEKLPALDRALTLGEVTWSAVRELARVATAETEREWLEASKGRTIREVERLVAGREPGDRPSDPARSGSRNERHVLRFEVAADTLATFRQAMKALRQQSGGHLDDDEAILLMARCVLGGRDAANDTGNDAAGRATANDAGRASYQLALTLCERCQRGFQEANGERIEVGAAIVDMARCDARHVGHVRSTQALPETEAEADEPRTHVGLPELIATNASPESTPRATQTIPPALRRQVLARDAGRCVVPGCRHATFVDLHHIQPRTEGGRHDADNLAVVCSAHHRAVHRGRLTITGRVSTGLRFQYVDGTPYGKAPVPQLVATLGKVFRALRGLGFKEREARRALDAVTATSAEGPTIPTAEELLRSALQTLAPAPVHRRASCRER